MVTERIGRFSASEIKFNLMAVIGSRRDRLRAALAAGEELRRGLAAALDGSGPPGPAAAELPSDPDTLRARLQEVEEEAGRLNLALAMEEDKARRWRDENLRRRTDFIPAIFNLLGGLAEEQQLVPLIAKAKEAEEAKKAAS